MQLTSQTYGQAVAMLSMFTEATANNTDIQTDEVLSEIANYFKELADFVNESNVIINKTVSSIIIIYSNIAISHLLYFLHRPEWEFILIICPLRATRKIMAINLSPQGALHLSTPNVHSIDHTSTTAMEHTQIYSTTMCVQHRQTLFTQTQEAYSH